MNNINSHNCNLNIRYDLPDEVWAKVSKIYENMPGWIGYKSGIPYGLELKRMMFSLKHLLSLVDYHFMHR
jgi:hypothetical protein